MAKRKTTKADRAARAQAVADAERLRRLAERAEAALTPEQRRPAGASNAEWLRQLAEKAQAELDARKAAEA
jgi:nucleotide-binding universal stress UspA family protein